MSNNAPLLAQDTPAWLKLHDLAGFADDINISDLFDSDKQRFKKFHVELDGVLFDFSKHILNDEILTALLDLLENYDFENKKAALVSGNPINLSENRSVLHTALRGTPCKKEGVEDFVKHAMNRIEEVSTQIRENTHIKDVINVGIGGSHLGPSLACDALSHIADGPNVHFISNVDGQYLSDVLEGCDPAHTAVIVASKTFTTQETMANANAIKDWLSDTQYVYAITDNNEEAESFGVPADHILPMKDWIGGRYSVWGCIGLSVAVAIGFTQFKEFLRGAAEADQHFLNAAPEKNIPVMMGLIGVWYRNFLDYRAHVVLPYAQGLDKFPLYLQQIDMESNGKSVSNEGTFVEYKTGPVVFGNAGTDAQHTFMQCLHQGTDTIPADFILFKDPIHNYAGHHSILNANALAQSKALMEGQDNEEEPHRYFPGNRPSSTLILERQDAYHLGLLMAFYEHKVFVQGAIWGINSFDQWGVELGKTNAKSILEALNSENKPIKTDPSTESLLNHLCGEKDKNL